jgi:fluoride exporter
MNAMMLLYVAMGGAVGSMARFVMSSWINKIDTGEFPFATFIINIGGSFLMGVWIAVVALMLQGRGKELHMLIAVGFLGGFTTFSTFSVESYMLIEKGLWLQAGAYIGGSVVFSITGLLAGMWFLRTIHGQ